MGKKKVTHDQKVAIVTLLKANQSVSHIMNQVKVSKTCVYQTLYKLKKNGDFRDLQRSGRPRKTTVNDDRMIYRMARANPKLSAKNIAQEINGTLAKPVSRRTVQRRLNDRKLYSYIAARKPALTINDRYKRIKFCRRLLQCTQETLNKIIFTDESNFEVMNRKSRVIVRRHRNEKYHKQFLAARGQGGGGSIGIWGAISYHGTGLHQLYEGRLNRFGYIDILENALIPSRDLYFTENDEWYLQQDNAPCHTAYDVQDWFDENKIKVITWPARSPDLNIIENVWAWIDRYLDQYACTTLSQL